MSNSEHWSRDGQERWKERDSVHSWRVLWRVFDRPDFGFSFAF